jgi:hypothetical protein
MGIYAGRKAGSSAAARQRARRAGRGSLGEAVFKIAAQCYNAGPRRRKLRVADASTEGANQMNGLNLRCYALSVCVATISLEGCGRSQPPISVPGTMPQGIGAASSYNVCTPSADSAMAQSLARACWTRTVRYKAPQLAAAKSHKDMEKAMAARSSPILLCVSQSLALRLRERCCSERV